MRNRCKKNKQKTKAEVNVLFGQEITFELWDYDPGFPGVQNDDPLGRCGWIIEFLCFVFVLVHVICVVDPVSWPWTTGCCFSVVSQIPLFKLETRSPRQQPSTSPVQFSAFSALFEHTYVCNVILCCIDVDTTFNFLRWSNYFLLNFSLAFVSVYFRVSWPQACIEVCQRAVVRLHLFDWDRTGEHDALGRFENTNLSITFSLSLSL